MIERTPTLIYSSIVLIVLTIFYSFVGFFTGLIFFILIILWCKNTGGGD